MEIIKYLELREEAYRGVIERGEVRLHNCPVCSEKISNYEYTRGMITAFTMVKDFVNGNRRS
jgi:hypothetical protein